MSETPTPGQICYEAYWRSEAGKVPFAWATLNSRARQPWDAAAQAVLAMPPTCPMVHALRAGVPLCGFSREAPVHWPAGHRWSMSREDITCPRCCARLAQCTPQEETP